MGDRDIYRMGDNNGLVYKESEKSLDNIIIEYKIAEKEKIEAFEKLTEAKKVLLAARYNLNKNWRKELVKYEEAYAYFNLLSAKKKEGSYDTLSEEEKVLEEEYLAQAEEELEEAEEDLAKKAPAGKKKYDNARDEYNMLYKEYKVARGKFLELESKKSDAENLLEINSSNVGGKRKSKGNSKKVSKKPVVSQKKQSECKEIFGKKMKIYKMPDSRKEYCQI
jgi:hypothetical protein